MNGDLDTFIVLIGVAVVILLISLYMEMKRKPRKPEYVTRELLECTKCRYRVERDFEPGDFISMYKDNCPKCGSLMKVIAIYRVEEKIKTPF